MYVRDLVKGTTKNTVTLLSDGKVFFDPEQMRGFCVCVCVRHRKGDLQIVGYSFDGNPIDVDKAVF